MKGISGDDSLEGREESLLPANGDYHVTPGKVWEKMRLRESLEVERAKPELVIYLTGEKK